MRGCIQVCERLSAGRIPSVPGIPLEVENATGLVPAMIPHVGKTAS